MAEYIAGGNGLQKRMIASAMRGFIAEMAAQLVEQGKAERFRQHMAEVANPFSLSALAFQASYVAGLLAGFVSPVTDLFGLPAFVDAVDDFIKNAVRSIGAHAAELMTEGSALSLKFKAVKDELNKAVVQIMTDLAKDPKQLFALIDKAGDTAVQTAGAAGHGAAKEVIHVFESPWEEEKDEDRGWASTLPKDTAASVLNPGGAALATASRAWEYGTERAKKKIFSTPWARVGYGIGHAVGAIVANVLLLIFTEGIGNAIAAVGEAVGKLAPALRAFGIVATKIEEAMAAIGGAVRIVEEGIAIVAKTVLKPLEKVLAPFLKLLEDLQGWLRKLLGFAEKEGAEVAASAGGKLAGNLGEDLPKGTPKLGGPKGEPHVPGSTAAADDAAANAAAKLETQPKGEPKLKDEPTGEPKPKKEAKEPKPKKEAKEPKPKKEAKEPKPKKEPKAKSEPVKDGGEGAGKAKRKKKAGPKKPKGAKAEAGPPRSLDERIADAERDFNDARRRVVDYKKQRLAAGEKQKGGPFKALYNEQERLWTLKRAKAFPNRQILEQAEIVGVRGADGTMKASSTIAQEGRTLDFVEIDGKRVIGGDLKSKDELINSIEGGLKEPSIDARFRDKSKIGLQHGKEEKILAEAKQGGKLVIRGRDVRTGAMVTVEVDAADYAAQVVIYGEVYPN
jgi:outer membrane biosynthesis protein TonB